VALREWIQPESPRARVLCTLPNGGRDGKRRPDHVNLSVPSHLAIRRRERKQQKFKSQGSAQRFLSTHGAIYNTFNTQTQLIR
jgi:transposase-like protein